MSACGINNEDMSEDAILELAGIAVDMVNSVADRLRDDIRLQILSEIIERLTEQTYGINDNCERVWHRFNGKLYRYLSAHMHEQICYGGESRWFIYRLPDTDPRPWGRLTDSSLGKYLDSLPFGVWIEIEFAWDLTESAKAVLQ